MSSKDVEDHLSQDAKNDDVAQHDTEIDPSVARAVVRKFDLRIMPLLFGLWFFAALDRANIGDFHRASDF